MEEAPENGKESSSAHANGMNEWMNEWMNEFSYINWLFESLSPDNS